MANSDLQRAVGSAEVGFTSDGLSHLYQSGCAKLLLPKSYSDRAEAVFVNTAGGATGGDRLSLSVTLEENAALTTTTQAAERIYLSAGGQAEITNTARLGAGAALDWLPQESILFDGSALDRRLNIEMHETATFLGAETIVLGRRAMGETLTRATLTDRWRITRGARIAYADTLRFTDPADLTHRATLDGNRALTTLVYVAPDAEDRLTQARRLLPSDIEAAASAWNGMLIARFLAPDAQPLRAALITFLTAFRGRRMPRVWHM